jgi:histidine triad (HIT) family protein
MSCAFCDIIAKKAPAKIYYEDDDIIVFHDHYPKAPTHLLICPRQHFVDLLDTNSDVLAKMHDVTRKIAKQLGADEAGFRLQVNNGAPAGQIIFHLHFHFMTTAKTE